MDSVSDNAGAGPDLKKAERARRRPDAIIDRLPPFSNEAEMGVLGCILISPNECLPEARARLKCGKEAFYDLRHQTIWEAFCTMANNGGIDLITLHQYLKDNQTLEQVGGDAYLSGIADAVPSSANLSNYLDIVWEKYLLRKTIHTCTDIVARVYDYEGEVDQLLDEIDIDLGKISRERMESRQQDIWNLGELTGYDVKHDPNCVIGINPNDDSTSRYLCKGYGAWIIGSSGIGKSVLVHQQAYCYALGLPFLGTRPVKPCRILIVQSENDIGDNAEMTQGIINGMKLDVKTQAQLNGRVRVIRCRGKTGEIFCRWLETEIRAWRADIVYVDPLLRFAGIDVSRQDQCTQFLNNSLDPVLANTGVVLIGAHHTGKPKAAKDVQNWTIYDQMYSGIGSSELVNWARAVEIIRVMGNGIFERILAKRGVRAWATHPNGEATTSVFLKHSSCGLFWEQMEPPPPEDQGSGERGKSGRKSKVDEVAFSNLGPFLQECPIQGEGLNIIAKRLEKWLATEQNMDVSLPTCKRTIPALVHNKKLRKDADSGLYFCGEEA